MNTLRICFGIAILVAGVGAAIAQETAKVPSTDSERVANMEKQLHELAARKPKLDCTTKYFRTPTSNNFEPTIPTPVGYQLVGGSCGFDSWTAGDNPTMIRVGPSVSSDGTASAWGCYA